MTTNRKVYKSLFLFRIMRKQRKNLTGTLRVVCSLDSYTIDAIEEAGHSSEKFQSEIVLEVPKGDIRIGENYVEGDDSKTYRVPEKELHPSVYDRRIGMEGLRVKFETPLEKKGRNRWAYKVRPIKRIRETF